MFYSRMVQKRTSLFLLLACSLALFSCTTRYNITEATPSKTMKLDRGQVAYIALPADGTYGNTVYNGSGQQTATALQSALSPFSSMVVASSVHEDAPEAMSSAAAKNARYVFVPLITNWVHRKAAWSGRASGVSITVAIYDLSREEPDRLVMQKDLRVQGRNATFVSQFPGDLAKALLVHFANEIY